MLYWLSSYCKNGGIAHGLLHLHSVVVFCLYFVYCMIILFVDNLFFLLGRPVRLLWQPSDCMAIFVILCHAIIGE